MAANRVGTLATAGAWVKLAVGIGALIAMSVVALLWFQPRADAKTVRGEMESTRNAADRRLEKHIRDNATAIDKLTGLVNENTKQTAILLDRDSR